jgi:hypothetical protein
MIGVCGVNCSFKKSNRPADGPFMRGPDDTIVTVRSMDWQSHLGANPWVFPRGIHRDSAAGENSLG